MRLIKPILLPVILMLLCMLFIIPQSNSQPNKRTCHWYSSRYIGLDFNTGDPVEDPSGICNSVYRQASTVMSDTNGNLLFYSDGEYIFHKNHGTMKNDYGYPEVISGHQGTIAIPKPGSDNIYYVFIVSRSYGSPTLPLYYFTIDMTHEDGLGEVVGIETLDAGWDAADNITATFHKNKKDIWVVTRKYNQDSYAAFLVTENGVNPVPILSPAPNRELSWGPSNYGALKISLDKKFLVSTFHGNPDQGFGVNEICEFDNQTGHVTYLYGFGIWQFFIPPPEHWYEETTCEFSPCSKFLYVGVEMQEGDLYNHVFQFDMKLIHDSASFIQSGIVVDSVQGSCLQLAPDGRIYCLGKCVMFTHGDPLNAFLGRINNPGGQGLASGYQENVLEFQYGEVDFAWVNFMNDYLLRFDFEGECALDTFYFDPWFFPEPTWIHWNFGDPASGSQNISEDLYPTHVFTQGGEFEVNVMLTYPNGRMEVTSRVVEVDSVPWPDLGLDTLICPGSSLILNANCSADFYSWSTGQWGTSSITVSDSGLYWVRTSYSNGCDNYDTIYVGLHPEITFDETGLVITATACGGTSGSITGLSVSGTEPLQIEWKDLSGNVLGNDTALFNLGVGQYYLSVTDGNGCVTESPLYTIIDAGGLQVDSVTVSGSACGQDNGVIQVYAVPLPGGQLFYSIDNGQNFFDNGGLFENLPPGEYAVMIQDENDCQGVYQYNPVQVADLVAPQLVSANSLPEVDFLQNGEIILDATGSTANLYYSIDSGATWQTNDGTFTGLATGLYDCSIRDENGCDTIFQVEVERFWATILKAVVENTDTCSGTIFEIPIKVQNFNDVSKFRMHLAYNRDMIECTGFTGPHPAVADSLQAFINDATGDILFLWNDDTPATLPNQTSVVKLMFSDRTIGEDVIDWYSQAEESYFLKGTADTLKAEFTLGAVRISSPPEILWINDMILCEGGELHALPLVEGSNPITEKYWIKPDGSIQMGGGILIEGVLPSQGGTYTFVATDDRGCTSEKSIMVTVIPTPDPAIPNGDTLLLEEGESIDAGDGFISYSWSTGDSSQTIVPATEGWYNVTVTTTNDCQATDSVYVKFLEEPPFEPSQYFYIPNAFTPDGDGRNDVFKLIPAGQGFTIYSLQFTIYDRWGGRVFESADIGQGWDGMKNGKPCPEGAYVYRITLQIEGAPGLEGEQLVVGTVVLVR